MQKAFVLDKNKQPLMPCHPARVRQLLKKGKGAVFRLKPFTIILRDRSNGGKQAVALKFDPGSEVTAIALVVSGENRRKAVWCANLHHRGQAIRRALLSRAPRFLNRMRLLGWLTPSLKSRVDNIDSWTLKLKHLVPITGIASERVRFDMQKLRNPELKASSTSEAHYLVLSLKHICYINGITGMRTVMLKIPPWG